MEQSRKLMRAKVKQRRRVPWDAVLRHILRVRDPLWPQTNATIPKAQRQPIACAKRRVVTGRTRHLTVARQDRVVK